MNAFLKFAEIQWQDSSLSQIAKENPFKSMDQKELDKPLTMKDTTEKKETRPLTPEEEKDIQAKTGWTDEQMKKCTIDEDGVVHYRSINEDMEGQQHEPSGVTYIRKTIELNGVQVEVVVPDFDSAFDAQLPDDMLKDSNGRQFRECNQQLKDAVENDPDLASKFTKDQLEDIMDGRTPEGYTWHHDVESGKMQLVESKQHNVPEGGAPHTGGRSLWGGGY